eukprot:TRINITY_DN18720_c0_g1_i1.p1 TRINITY_DN18720_c0_g1~~TRINITY_DN18720_c0_g1_i1.p1  ORF type:complete len:905 (+),score=234.53 TRINITY_DN18720_c0_g1_i1:83-2797(+)
MATPVPPRPDGGAAGLVPPRPRTAGASTMSDSGRPSSGGALRPTSGMGGGLRSSRSTGFIRRPMSAAVSIGATSSSAGLTDEGTSPKGTAVATEHHATASRAPSEPDEEVAVCAKQRGAPLPSFQRPDSTRGDRMLPAPSVSKTGYMSELAIGTRQLARSGAQALAGAAAKRRKSKPTPLLPVDLNLDEFGKGARGDEGPQRRKYRPELVSSPRRDLRLQEQEDSHSKGLKAAHFCKSMELQFTQDGKPVRAAPPDPIDVKYQKLGLRRPLSSRERARREEGQPVSEPGDPLAELEALLRGGDSPHTVYGDTEITRPALAFNTRQYSRTAERGGHLPFDEGVPCIGQYMPRYCLVMPSSPRAQSWERQLQRTVPRQHRGRPPPQPRRPAPTVSPPGQPKPGEPGAAAAAQPAAPDGTAPPAAGAAVAPAAKPQAQSPRTRPSVCFLTPGRGPLCLDKSDPKRVTLNTFRPSPHFREAGAPNGTAAPDVDYWPYDLWFKRERAALQMKYQVPREAAGRTGYTMVLSGLGGCGPDSVYDIQRAMQYASRAAGSVRFDRQVPANTTNRILSAGPLYPASHFQRDYEINALSTVPRPLAARDWSRAPPRGTSEKDDRRKGHELELDPDAAWRTTRPRVTGGCSYDLQTGRPDFLLPNPYIQLEYDPRLGAVTRRVPVADFHSRTARGAGSAAVIAKRQATSEWEGAELRPSTASVKRRTDRAPRLEKREHWRRVAVPEVRENMGRPGVFRGLGEDGEWWDVTVLRGADDGGSPGRAFAARVDGGTSPSGAPVVWGELHLSDMERKVQEPILGHQHPPERLDRVYDWQEAQLAALRRKQGIGFDKQLTRERRNKALQKAQHSADAFYDPPGSPVGGHVSFAKALSRNKRAPGHFHSGFPGDKEDAKRRR